MKTGFILLTVAELVLVLGRRCYRVPEMKESTLRLGPRPRIFGGREAAQGQFRFMIFAMINVTDTGITRCSASLIHPEWVLLAAHCLYFPGLRPEDVILVGGKADLLEYAFERVQTDFRFDIPEELTSAQERRARSLHIHPGYRDSDLVNDLALIRLVKRFTHPLVSTISLARERLIGMKTCLVLGWGLTEDNSKYDNYNLNFLEHKKATKDFCMYSKPEAPFLCLIPDGRGICRGDSGSPLVCEGRVWGVASHCLSPDDSCGSSLEDYFAEVYAGLDWINSVYHNSGQSLNGILNIKHILVYFSFIFWVST